MAQPFMLLLSCMGFLAIFLVAAYLYLNPSVMTDITNLLGSAPSPAPPPPPPPPPLVAPPSALLTTSVSTQVPSLVFAPYLYMDGSPDTIARMLTVGGGSNWVILAFGENYANSAISWDSGNDVDITKVKANIETLKKKGGGAALSFGGDSVGKKGSRMYGEITAQYAPDPSKICDAYIACADLLGLNWLDFDIEGALASDATLYSVRHKAIALMQRKRSDIFVSFTLSVNLSGLDSTVTALLADAVRNNVKVNILNIMTMYLLSGQNRMSMADAAIKAATATKPTLATLGNCKLGMTCLLGKNKTENFTPADATALASFAKQNSSWIQMLACWTLSDAGGWFSDPNGSYANAFVTVMQ
jgi:chitinase